MDLLIGTTNPGKLREYMIMLETLPASILTLSDVGLDTMDVEETADSFEGNAELKALAYTRASGMFALADDSGLVVDALGGRPGVYSARYAETAEARNRKLLGELADTPDEARTARFVCVIAVANPQTMTAFTVLGKCEGHIAREPGESVSGFGYDPIFIPAGYDRVLSALPMNEKNQLSHRGDALRKMLPILQQMAQGRGE